MFGRVACDPAIESQKILSVDKAIAFLPLAA
jgi:hypothetical protein